MWSSGAKSASSDGVREFWRGECLIRLNEYLDTDYDEDSDNPNSKILVINV